LLICTTSQAAARIRSASSAVSGRPRRRQGQLPGQVPAGAFQQGGLARAGRAHQVDGEDAAFPQPLPVSLSQVVVLGQDLLLQRHVRPWSWSWSWSWLSGPGSSRSVQPHVAHMIKHPYRGDGQLLAGKDLNVGAAARQSRIGPSGSNVCPQARHSHRIPGSVISRLAPSNAVPSVARSKQNSSAWLPPRTARRSPAAPRRSAGREAALSPRPPGSPRSRARAYRSADPRSGSPTSRSTIPHAAEGGLQVHEAGRIAGDVADDRRGECRAGGSAAPASAWSASSPGTTATSRPSQATYIGSMPSSSAAPRTSGRTGMSSSLTSTPTSAALAISLRIGPRPRGRVPHARTPGTASSSPRSGVQRGRVGLHVGFDVQLTAGQHDRAP